VCCALQKNPVGSQSDGIFFAYSFLPPFQTGVKWHPILRIAEVSILDCIQAIWTWSKSWLSIHSAENQ
ncbi:MAG TPA: hypothetical protein DCS26_08435, partial [Porticoccaceae bacterium]|nr:hypothetical protein [Porticoccaceae bacterium]